MAEAIVSEFNRLCNERDLAAYRFVGAASTAIARLNFDELDDARDILLRAKAEFDEADRAVDQFRAQEFRKNSNKESTHGNRPAAA